MSEIGAIAFVALAGALLILFWRLASNRRSLPCPAWLSWLVELDNPLFRNNRAQAIIAGLDVKPGMTALDAGCGPGRVCIPLAVKVGPLGHVVVLDAQEAMLQKAAAKAKRARLSNIEFRHARLGEGRPISGRFDRAVLAAVLGEIPNRAAAMTEIYNALACGGILAVTELIADPHFQSMAVVRKLAREAGYKEHCATGSRLSYTLYLEKPASA